MSNKNNSTTRLVKSGYGWELYDSPTYTEGISAVYKHRTGAWLSIAPATNGYELIIFHTGTLHRKVFTDAKCLIRYLSQPEYAMHGRKNVSLSSTEGDSADAYDHAGL